MGDSEKPLSITIKQIEDLLTATVGEISGTDTKDEDYESLTDLWDRELKRNKKSKKVTNSNNEIVWYSKAYDYWESEANCPLSDDGVLGGYGKLTPQDSRDSNLFVDELHATFPALRFDRAADCGAGIGRVAKHFLLHRFQHVDLIEQSPRLLAAAPEYIGADSARTTCIVQGLQDFKPLPNTYDVIWIQWVIGHLHDLDFIRFFRRCAAGLREGGMIILKDNAVCGEWTFVVDRDDSSVARHITYLKLLIELSGLSIVLERTQKDFPEELYPVYMLAMVPNNTATLQEKETGSTDKMEV